MEKKHIQKIVKAALALAESGAWSTANLSKIAKAADLPLSQLFTLVRSKSDILKLIDAQLTNQIFDEVGEIDDAASTRDTLFDLLMTRFEIMNAHRAAYLVLYAFDGKDVSSYPAAFKQNKPAMRLVAEAGGVDTSGLVGTGRLSTLVYMYLQVFAVWSKDETEDLAPTMKALDKALSKAENWAVEFKNFDLSKVFGGK